MSPPAAEWSALTRHPRRNDQLLRSINDFNLSIPSGASYGFAGDKKSGAFTLVYLLLDLLKPHSGEVSIFGQPPGPAVKDKIGFCPEFFDSFPAATTSNVLKLFTELKASDQPSKLKYPRELQVDRLPEEKFDSLTTDQKKRLGLAAAAGGEPELLLLLEPTAGLTPASQENLFTFLNRRQKKDDATTLVVSTEINLIRRLCEKSIYFENSRQKNET